MNPTKQLVSSLCATFLVAGCASWRAPSADELSALPVVQFGQPVPAGRGYILYFPPDQPIPVNASIRGNIFAKEAEQRLDVTLRRGIYSYKEWISYDGKSWSNARDVLKTDARIVIPGYRHPEPGEMSIRMDEKR